MAFHEKDDKSEQALPKQYISGAGGTIVSQSILQGTAPLKWMFKEDSGLGNGWVAFGEGDTQEYVDDANNLSVVDFNTLANIEPAVLDIFYLPVGSDLMLCSDKSGKYFVDTKTGAEIREPVAHPLQAAFEKNLKFLNQERYPAEFFQALFTAGAQLAIFTAGMADFPSGEVVLADPLAYLGTPYDTKLARAIPAGRYPVEVAILHSDIAGLRIAAAKLKISGGTVARYELALPKGQFANESGRSGAFSFFGVDTGLACFADSITAQAYHDFITGWHTANPDKNRYDDYFAALFQQSYQTHPQLQRNGGDFLYWQIPATPYHLVFFASGMGDGIYSGYWGLDIHNEAVELIIPFMNPQYF